MGGYGLILFKRLFRESFFQYMVSTAAGELGRTSPILLWRPSTMIWALHLFSMVMCTIEVEYQHVDQVSLKHSMLREKRVLIWQMHTTHNNTRKNVVFYACTAQSSPAPEKKSRMFPELTDATKKRVNAKNVIPYLRNITIPILLCPILPPSLYLCMY